MQGSRGSGPWSRRTGLTRRSSWTRRGGERGSVAAAMAQPWRRRRSVAVGNEVELRGERRRGREGERVSGGEGSRRRGDVALIPSPTGTATGFGGDRRARSLGQGNREEGGDRGKGGLLGWAAQMSRPAGPSGPVRGGVRSRKGFALFFVCLFLFILFSFISFLFFFILMHLGIF